jgi:hypothetical protein
VRPEDFLPVGLITKLRFQRDRIHHISEHKYEAALANGGFAQGNPMEPDSIRGF